MNFGVNKGELGKWHSHPNRKDTSPVPSIEDLSFLSGHFIYYPSIILSKNGSRFYFPRILGELTSPNLRQKIVPYSREVWLSDLKSFGHVSEECEFSPGIGHEVNGYCYLPFDETGRIK